MKRVALVSCAARKVSRAVQTQDLYDSDLFRKSRAWAQQNADSWFILSALHGLLPPDKVTAPYDVTLNRMPRAERQAWADRVMTELENQITPGDTVLFLAGAKYREDLHLLLEAAGFRVEVPMRGLGIGRQLAWLKGRLMHPRKDGTDSKAESGGGWVPEGDPP